MSDELLALYRRRGKYINRTHGKPIDLSYLPKAVDRIRARRIWEDDNMAVKITEADRQFSLAVRTQAGWQCEHCGLQGGPDLNTKKMECCHLIGRRNASTRWDMLNAVCMCHVCHRNFTEEPRLFNNWIEEKFGEARWPILYEKKRLIQKNNAITRKQVAAHYRGEVKRLTADPEHRVVSWI